MLCWGTVNASTLIELIEAAGAAGFRSISVSPRLYEATRVAGVNGGSVRDVRESYDVLDAWHFARSGGSLDQLVGLPPGMISVVQLCDRIEPEPGAAYVPMAGRLLPGEGELPLVDWSRRLLADHSQAIVGVEVFSTELQALPAEAAAQRA